MNLLTVRYLNHKLGTLGSTPAGVVFEYDPAFLASGQELSPLNLRSP